MAPKQKDKNMIGPGNNLGIYIEVIRMPLLVFLVVCIISSFFLSFAVLFLIMDMILFFILAFRIGSIIVHQREGTIGNAAKAGLIFGLAVGVITAAASIAFVYMIMLSTNNGEPSIADKLNNLTNPLMIGAIFLMPITSVITSIIASVMGAAAFRD